MELPPFGLGPFDLVTRIGSGGMGEIWRGVHRRQQAPVAVKVITAARARSRIYLEGFRREVQAVARLSHRHIVWVFDYGVIPEETAEASQGALVAGSPYLVMELAGGGPLNGLRFPLAWDLQRAILLSLLQALGHAHARSVIHRDLKPANVLLPGDDDVRPTLKLTDFGVAQAADRHAADLTNTREAPVGTPNYMAPEQLEGRWRDYGPWTDLYSLGIMAWELAEGHPPFQAPSLVSLAFKHLREELPPLTAGDRVPRGFEAWLRRLTAKDPRQRFQLARDAAWTLECLAPPLVRTVADTQGALVSNLKEPGDDDVAQAMTIASADPLPADLIAQLDPPTLREQDLYTPLEARPWERILPAPPPQLPDVAPLPPLPDSWAPGEAESATPFRLVGAGMGLWGLRALPLVDRRDERDRLWDALLEVRREGRPWVVVLEGHAGVGKSRLAEWLCERAHELGTAIVLRAVHGPMGGPANGLRGMIAEQFQCLGLPREKVLGRLENLLRARGCTDEYEWQALTELVGAEEGIARPDSRVRFSSAAQRYHLVQRLLARLGEERPVVVWLDDVQWGSDALALVNHVMNERRRATRVLFLLTARQEALEDRSLERQMVGDLLASARSTHVDVPALTDGDSGLLIRELLGLSGDLAEQVRFRAHGNPLFAVQLVGHWVERGVLEPGADGFVLQAGARAEVPDNVHQLWRTRLERLLATFPEPASVALELAAALGQSIAGGELEAACGQMGIDHPSELLDLLAARRLTVPGQSGWAFAHPLLRESLERTSREGGRWAALNQACERMVVQRYGEGAPGLAARRVRHLLEAEAWTEALVVLKPAIREHLSVGEYAEAERLLVEWDRAADALDLPPSDPCRGEGWVLLADARRLQWKFTDAAEWTDRALVHAIHHGWEPVHGDALLLMANIARQQGDLERAEQVGLQTLSRFQRQGDAMRAARILLALAATFRVKGDHLRAIGYYEQARALFEDLDEDDGMARCLLGLGHVHRAQKHLKRARSLYREARVICERIGSRHEVASCINGLAELDRYAGELAAAEAGYREALVIQSAIGSDEAMVTETNLAALQIRRADYHDALTRLTSVAEGMEQAGQRAFLPYTYVFMLACAAGLGDLDTFGRIYPLAVKLIGETSTMDVDLAEYAELAGDLSREAGRGALARQAYELALAQYRGLGDELALERLRKRLDHNLPRLER